MKKLLPILLCYVLMTTQVYAISGGPVFGGSGIDPIGTYSGVIIVKAVKDFVLDPDTGSTIIDPTTGQAKTTTDDSTVSLGLFSLGVPTVSVATGAFIQFVNGDVFTGNIVASVDPDSSALSGIVEGTSSYSLTFNEVVNGAAVTLVEVIDNSIAGKVTAQISGTRAGSLASARVVGTANLIVNSGGDRVTGGSEQGELVQNFALDCMVTGFRQSTAFTSVTSLGFGANATQ